MGWSVRRAVFPYKLGLADWPANPQNGDLAVLDPRANWRSRRPPRPPPSICCGRRTGIYMWMCMAFLPPPQGAANWLLVLPMPTSPPPEGHSPLRGKARSPIAPAPGPPPPPGRTPRCPGGPTGGPPPPALPPAAPPAPAGPARRVQTLRGAGAAPRGAVPHTNWAAPRRQLATDSRRQLAGGRRQLASQGRKRRAHLPCESGIQGSGGQLAGVCVRV